MNALSVIVPMLNEERTIVRTLESIAAAASRAEAGIEVSSSMEEVPIGAANERDGYARRSSWRRAVSPVR